MYLRPLINIAAYKYTVSLVSVTDITDIIILCFCAHASHVNICVIFGNNNFIASLKIDIC